MDHTWGKPSKNHFLTSLTQMGWRPHGYLKSKTFKRNLDVRGNSSEGAEPGEKVIANIYIHNVI